MPHSVLGLAAAHNDDRSKGIVIASHFMHLTMEESLQVAKQSRGYGDDQVLKLDKASKVPRNDGREGASQ